MSHPLFREFNDSNLPDIIYFDTSFVIETLIKGQRYHQQCKDFIKRLSEKQPIIIFSDLLKPELWCGAISVCIRNYYKGDVDIRQKINERPKLIKHYHNKAVRIQKDFFDLLQRFKNWASVEIKENILNKALSLMKEYSLPSYDAIHIATMEEWDITDIAVFDQHIENIPSIKIWSVNGVERYIKREKRGGTLK